MAALGGDDIDDGIDTAVDKSKKETQNIQTKHCSVGVTVPGVEGHN